MVIEAERVVFPNNSVWSDQFWSIFRKVWLRCGKALLI